MYCMHCMYNVVVVIVVVEINFNSIQFNSIQLTSFGNGAFSVLHKQSEETRDVALTKNM